MEAALRTAYWQLTGSNPPADAFQEIRGQKPWREASFTIGETTVRLAVASGLGSARQLMDALRSGQVHYDFVEVMACPGGCAGGAASPSTTARTLPPSGASSSPAGCGEPRPLLPREPPGAGPVPGVSGPAPVGEGPPPAAHNLHTVYLMLYPVSYLGNSPFPQTVIGVAVRLRALRQEHPLLRRRSAISSISRQKPQLSPAAPPHRRRW